ncbi:MAG: S8/S53 family peptidase [Myxococcales bacterium]|nr:S8/S53 family peptidase [Myxococcales bacterium]
MTTGPESAEFSTDQRHVFRVLRRWVGHNLTLIDDREVEFTEFLPLRPRGAQVLLDPFEPQAGEQTLTGRVLSPARVLDPGAEVEAWCNGESLEVGGDGSFTATATLHAGTDQIHVRALDATGLAGRGYVSTWTPKPLGERDRTWLDGNTGRWDEDDEEPPPGVRKPTRYGRTRAEVQRFSIVPALLGHDSIQLVLKDEDDAELGRVELRVTHESQMRSFTEWVCITAIDPAEDPPLPAVEDKVLRVPSLGSTFVLELSSGRAVGEPLRMSGLDPSSGPDLLQELPDPSQPGPLKLVVGGRYGLDELNLRWLTTSDRDDVLLPGEGVEAGDGQLGTALGNHAGSLGELDPVDLEPEQVAMPAGWGALVLEGRETVDPWEHDEQVDVLTYQAAPELDSPEANDFVHTGRQPRVLWHGSEEWAINPDQVLVKLAEGTADADVVDLCRRMSLRVAGTVRRDGSVLLESPEPLDLGELQERCDALAGEGIVEAAALNYIMLAEHERVASIRAPDLLRSAAVLAPQPGCYRPYDILSLRHHLQTRAFPAQQIIEHLRLQQTPAQSQISLAITDDGFGNATSATISPDFAAPRLPWGGRLPGNGGSVGTGTAWGAFPANIGATLAFTNAAMTDPGGSGHGTRTLHAMAGGGRAFVSLTATIPPLTAAAAIANYVASPWCVGVAPMATVLPMRTIGVAGSTWFAGMSAIRFAFLQGIPIVSTSAGANSAGVPAAAAAGGWYNTMVTPILNQARAIGGIWVVSGGNQPLAHNQHFHSVLAPTGARNAGSNPVVAVTPTSQSLLPTAPLGPNFPLTFTNPWDSVETSVLNGWDANFGPESTVAAPGDDLNLRAFTLTAASTAFQLGQGSGTSFAAPQTAGLLGLMKLADRIMGRATPRAGVATPADDANRLIDLLCFTAHKGQPLFSAPQAAAQFTTELGHGRIDAWAAVLSTLNDGPMFAGTAPHANLVNTGTYVQPAAVRFYGFELDTPAYHARPWLVNVNTGVAEQVVDAMALDPVIDRTDPARPVWSHQARAGGTGDRLLPPSAHPGPTPSYMLQFSIARARLQRYTHLCFQRGPGEPPIVATPGAPDLDPGTPHLFYYGLPVDALLRHDVTSAPVAPFGVDMRHFIFKAHTGAHDRRLRITFDRVELKQPVAATPVNVQWTINGVASGPRPHVARTGHVPVATAAATLHLGGASQVLYQPEATPLTIRFEVQGLGAANVSYAPPATPTSATFTPWGLGHRFLDVPGFRVHLRVELEPNLPRAWEVALVGATLLGAPVGDYDFAVASGGVRSAWGNAFNVGAVTPNLVVPVTPNAVTVRSPFIPGEAYRVRLLAQHRQTMNRVILPATPASVASNAIETLNFATVGGSPFQLQGQVQVRSVVVPQVFA